MRSDCGERRATAVTGGGAYRPAQQLACPRCESSNTKFCYYNNYNLSQPRHLCKSCRRYWTHGGSLRNVPVGGATRKPNKRSRPSNPISVQSSTLLNDAVSEQESVTSLLGSQEPTVSPAQGGYEVGPTTAFDEMGRYNSGGRGVWAFPEVADVAEGGGDLGSNTWQLGGVLVDGDCFQWPELAISMAHQGLEWS